MNVEEEIDKIKTTLIMLDAKIDIIAEKVSTMKLLIGEDYNRRMSDQQSVWEMVSELTKKVEAQSNLVEKHAEITKT